MRSQKATDVLLGALIGVACVAVIGGIAWHRHPLRPFWPTLRAIRRLPEFRGRRKQKV